MQLRELASLMLISRLEGDGNIALSGIQTDSRKVRPGDLFICIPGLVVDGHDFAREAVNNGAAALVVERDVNVSAAKCFVKDSRYAMAVIANHFYNYPSKHLKCIGITGTNGKTTTTYLIERILIDQGFRTGLMGTIQMKIGDQSFEAERTTQEALDLQRNLQRMVEAGTDYCVMEVSSHALELGRVKGTRFRTAVFTNLTQDHLDYHFTMDNYKAAKGLLFSRLGNEFHSNPELDSYAVLNADDAASAEYQRLTSAQVITYGIDRPADVRAVDVRVTDGGTVFRTVTFKGETEISMRLIGKFNVYNALAAISAALAEGIGLEQIKMSLESVGVIEGRMEPVAAGQDYLVVVDYSHTPDGLENALTTIREFARGRVITVFGCGGDRDRSKRPIMGKIAAQYSDYVLATSDNPRSEDPEAILRDIEPGIKAGGCEAHQYEMIVDRRSAIKKAVEKAEGKDVILIAGKGHETYQIIGGQTLDFDDRIVAKEAIRSRDLS